jgi:hypothetical protein
MNDTHDTLLLFPIAPPATMPRQLPRTMYRCTPCNWTLAIDPTPAAPAPLEKRCAKCNRVCRGRCLRGTYGFNPCDPRCTSATGFDCACSCGGRNHGRDHVVR